MSCKFVSIQGTYNKIELALFNATSCLDTISKLDVKASSHLIPLLEELLQRNNLTFSDLSFIAVDKGPGAFTSLRVTIATVNGLAFASHIPLIGINSLEALMRQVAQLVPQSQDRSVMIACLLNAYNNDVYYLLAPQGDTAWMGCKKIDDVLADLGSKVGDYQIWLAGNGVEVHRELIRKVVQEGTACNIVDPFVSICSATAVGCLAYEQWVAGKGVVEQVNPDYLKTQLFAMKK